MHRNIYGYIEQKQPEHLISGSAKPQEVGFHSQIFGLSLQRELFHMYCRDLAAGLGGRSEGRVETTASHHMFSP